MSKKILIIDDEKEMVSLLTVELTYQKYEVICAYDGEEGYEKYLRDKPDLIILDLMLPKCTGEEICRRIRRERQDLKTAIVMLTAKGDVVDRIIGKVKGADVYMSKPFDSEYLLSEMIEVLKKKDEEFKDV